MLALKSRNITRRSAYEKLGKNNEAKKLLAGLEAGSDDVAAMARFELAQLDDRTGQGDEAVKLYQKLIDKPSLACAEARGHAGARQALFAEQSLRGCEALPADQEPVSRYARSPNKPTRL